jgi:hypothetical protein
MSWYVQNSGPGPAIFKWIEVFVDNKQKRNWDEVHDALGFTGQYSSFTITEGSFRAIPPNAVLTLLAVPDVPASKAEQQKIANRLRIEGCICSVYEDSWGFTRVGLSGARINPGCSAHSAPVFGSLE